MEIQIVGKQIDLGDAIREHISDNLLDAVEKYSENPVDGQVTLTRDGHEYVSDIIVHLSTGLRAKSTGKAGEIYASVDDALTHLQKQLRRYKRRLKNHHKERNAPIEVFAEKSYVIESADEEEGADAKDDLQPLIIAETQIKVQTLAVGEAVMQMELAKEEFLVFRNSTHNGVNVVFRREDGNIGWIDPRRS